MRKDQKCRFSFEFLLPNIYTTSIFQPLSTEKLDKVQFNMHITTDILNQAAIQDK